VRILAIGGTRFIGRHFTAAALAAGHEVTLFHRGRTGAGLFPRAAELIGDRSTDLGLLAGASWDATADFCAYFPRQVRELAAALGGRGGQHLQISSVSAYRTPGVPGFREDAPLAVLADPAVEEVTLETYGGLKAACEQAAIAEFGAATTIVRPTYVVGPHDYSYRFTWWVDRIARGGTVLAPGDPADPIQVIDARDLAAWLVTLLEGAVAGAFHAVSPPPPFGFGDLLEAIAAVAAPPGTRLAWVDSATLLAAGADDEVLPLWPGASPEDATLNAADPSAALAAGLAPRPLRDTIADTRAAEARAPTKVPAGTGLDPVREAALIERGARAS
jgi:2'-hydroxyisoflavone reductase